MPTSQVVKVIASAPPPAPPAAPALPPPAPPPPAPPAADADKPEFRPDGAWGDVYVNYEQRNNIIPSRQVTVGVMAGHDETFKNGFQLGLFAGYDDTATEFKNNIDNGSHGVFGGGYVGFAGTNFSMDLLGKLDLLEFTADCINFAVAPAAPTNSISRDLTTYTVALNLNYRIDMSEDFSIEPTFGFRYSYYTFDGGRNSRALGIDDGQVFRLQIGARVRHTWWFDHHEGDDEDDEDDEDEEHDEFDRSLTVMAGALVYNDVAMSGFVADGLGITGRSAADDEFQLRLRAMFGANANLSEGLSAYARVEAYGGQNMIGIGGDLLGFSGRAGAKYQW